MNMNLPKIEDIEVYVDSQSETYVTRLTETTLSLVPVALQREMESKYNAFVMAAKKPTVALARANSVYQQADKTFAVYVIGMSNSGEVTPSIGFFVEGLNPKNVMDKANEFYFKIRDEILA
jgi:hypothetical protein